MSLILKGIDMPSEKEGWQMDLRIHGFDDGTMMVEKLTRNGRPPFKMYRAIQIPTPHGRIVDLKDIRYCAFSSDGKTREIQFLLETQVDALPTILEAEE